MTMPKLTAAEVQVLDAHLPAGLTDDMRDMALCLFEALVMLDSRCGQARPEGVWLATLHTMARVASLQLQHLASQIGGRSIYLAKGVAVRLSARDELMCHEFRGDYRRLAQKYNLTEMRVRQVVGAWQERQYRHRQGQLPGLD